MGKTLSGQLVQFGTTLDVNNYNLYGWPIAICGKNPSGLPMPINVDADGNLIVDVSVTPTGTQDVNLTEVGGAAVALGTATPSASLPVTPSKWVRHSVTLGASASQAIPNGAIYQYSVLTGTAGDGTMTGLPAGYSDYSSVPIVTGFTVTTDSASSAAVVWFTQS